MSLLPPIPNSRTHPLAYARWRLGDHITHAEWTETGIKCSAAGRKSTLTLVPGTAADGRRLLAALEALPEVAGERER
jgi:hypothetical protein